MYIMSSEISKLPVNLSCHLQCYLCKEITNDSRCECRQYTLLTNCNHHHYYLMDYCFLNCTIYLRYISYVVIKLSNTHSITLTEVISFFNSSSLRTEETKGKIQSSFLPLLATPFCIIN